jgi:hypothetical protein
MDAHEKYIGEEDNDMTYDAVHLFLSQLSRFLRPATYRDMEIYSEYDKLAYKWFEAFNKGT